jgi:CDGSH-type Zn-finger protein
MATVTPYRDGPYLIRGPFRMLDQEGNEIATRRPTIALCRCGKSRMRPLCDGTHRTIGFRAPSGAEAWPATDAFSPQASVQATSCPSSSADPERPGKLAYTDSRSPGAAADGTLARADNRELLSLLGRVREARAAVEHALTPPVAAETYMSLVLAEPLLQAADRLLEWLGVGVLAPHTTVQAVNGYGDTRRRKLDACRDAVEAALRSVPTAPGDRRVQHLRTLLQHAAEALRA